MLTWDDGHLTPGRLAFYAGRLLFACMDAEDI